MAFEGTERFEVIRPIGAGGMGMVYEAFDRERNQRVALKTLKRMDPQAIYRFKREFRSLASIVHPNLISLYELVSDGEQWFLTMELIEGGADFLSFVAPGFKDGNRRETSATEVPTLDLTSVDILRQQAPMAARPFRAYDGSKAETLREAMRQLVQGVSAIHRAGQLHRDLKPANVLVRPDGSVVVLDFGLAIELHRRPTGQAAEVRSGRTAGLSNSTDPSDGHIAGTVSYMSPEQLSGGELTEASDWYAVGCMLFEALTGALPFEVTSREVLRRRLLEDAPSPADLVGGIPEDLTSLCVDLLRRDPERRPGAAEILERLSGAASNSQPDSPLAGSEGLFVGRERERACLREGFQRVVQGRTTLLQVHGRSGAGKTVLIGNFLAELASRGDVVVLAGRCYEQESVPYKAIDTVVDALTVFLLRATDQALARLIPPNIQALARIFPVLQRVEDIREIAVAQPLSGDLQELRRQAFGALRELLVRIGNLHPLVISIDDLQWGDVDSAALLKELLRAPDAPRLLMLVSYRSEYIGSSACLDALRKAESDGGAGILHETLAVEALSPEEARSLSLQLLGSEDAEAQGQAARIAAESGGNPYFVYELARHLRSGAVLDAVQGLTLDQVLWMRVKQLPDDALRLLEVVAVSGQPVQLRYAQQAAAMPSVSPQIAATLRANHLVRSTGAGLTDDFETYHDRIRETILARLEPDRLKQHHGGLAASLEAAPGTAPEVLAAHFQGAGQKETAGRYYETAAEQAIHGLAFERGEDFLLRAETLAADRLVRARVQEKRIHFYTDLARFREAYEVGRAAAEPFGVRLPAKFNPIPFLVDLAETRLRLIGREVRDLVNLPTMADADLTQAIRLIAAVGKAAYQLRAELCVQILTKTVKLCLRRGNTPDCPNAYMAYGAIFLGGVLGNHKVGYEFGRLALDLVEKYDTRRQRAEVQFVVGYFATSWLRPVTEAEKLWEDAYRAGLETGDLFHTGCASCATVMSLFMRGVPLAEVWDASERLLEFLRRANLREPLGAVNAVRQAIRNLRGEMEDRTSFDTEDFREDEFVRQLEGFGSRHFAHFYFIVKAQCLYLWGDFEKADAMARASGSYLKDSPGMPHGAEHYFYEALIHARACPDAGAKRAWRIRQMRGIHKKFQRWAADCPNNFLAKERLIAAEIARLRHRREEALNAYSEVAKAAAQYGYLPVEALALDLASRLYREMDRRQEAAECQTQAVESYRRWGAPMLPLSKVPAESHQIRYHEVNEK